MALHIDSLALNLMLALAVMVSVAGAGCAAALGISRRRLEGRQLLAYGIAAGIVLHALMGLIVAAFPYNYRQPAAVALMLSVNASAWWYWHSASIVKRLLVGGRWQINTMLAAWGALSLLAILATFLPVRLPQPLPDPMYVLKRDHLHVRMQALTGGLPADNYLPYAVSEYFLRDIQLSQERPLLPGQEISNRPVLMALAVIPFRASLDPPPQHQGRLPRMNYVGISWPDAGAIGEDRYFRPFLTVASVLNASVLMAFMLILLELGLSRRYVLAGLLLLCSSPYILNQTIFTWPKMLAATFAILAAHAILFRRNFVLAGVLAALAYWSHPYAIVIAFSLGLCALAGDGLSRIRLRPAFMYGLSFSAAVLPWFLWSRLYLEIPSDLVQQNLGQGSTWIDLIWVRVMNFYTTLAPNYLSSYPFDGEKFLQGSLVSLTGIVGLLFFLQSYAGCWKYRTEHRELVMFAIVIPAVLLIGVFGIPAVPALHGFQAVGPLVLALGLKWMEAEWKPGRLWLLVFAQLAINAALIYFRMRSVVL